MRNFIRSFLIFLSFLLLSAATFAQTTYDWTGAGSTSDWSNPANWKSTTGSVTTNPATTCPGPTDQARIGVVTMTNTSNWPVVSSATSVGSIVWGTENYLNVYLTVNATFTVNGSINNTSAVAGNGSSSAYTFNISGTGTMNVSGDLNVGYDDGFSTSNPGNNNSFAFISTLNKLNIQGSTYLNIFQGDTNHRGFVPELDIKGGTFTTTSIQSVLTNSTTSNKLLTANLTVGNSSGSPTATLQLTGASALPSFSPYVTNTITFNNPGATVEYSGASQTVYTDNAVANLNNTISYYNIKFSGTGLKTALSGNLNIAGDFTNTMANDACNCNAVSLSAPTVNFNGTSQNLYGGGGNGTTFYTVDCSNSGTKTMQSGTFNLASTGVLTMSGSNTQLAAGSGIFTLLSDASSTATVAAIPSGCSITGMVNAQRYISNYRGWRFLSSPVYAGTDSHSNKICSINYLKNSIYVSGPTGTAGGFDWTGNFSIALYREDNKPDYNTFSNTNFRGFSNILTDPTYSIYLENGTYSIPQANGYQVFIRGDRALTDPATAKLASTSSAVTVTASGAVNQGQVKFVSWYTPGSTSLSFSNATSGLKGFNLVGNPYPSSIDWDKLNNAGGDISGTNISTYIYSYNFSKKQYGVYQKGTGGTGTNGASHIIGSGQGFFVVATASGATLTFNEAAKTSSSYTGVTTLMSTQPVTASVIHSLRLKMMLDSVDCDETIILLDNNAKSTFDPMEDAPYKPGNSKASLTSLSQDSVDIAINHLPLKNGQPVPLNVNSSVSGTFMLSMEDINGIPKMYDIWLKDNFAHDSVNLRTTNTHSFTIDRSNPATFGKNRFSVIVKQDTAYTYKQLSFTAARADNSPFVETHWTTANEENYTNFTVERSNDGGNTFTIVGGMWGTGAGDYGLVDKNAQTGTNLYRLKSEDINNTITYSNIATVVMTDNGNKIQLYPNPATSLLNVHIEPDNSNPSYEITITSSSGMLVKQDKSAGSQWQTSVSSLIPGTYLIQIVNKKDKSMVGKTKFVKM